MDEPVNDLDPQGIIEMRELIIRLNKEYGITILISSHILDDLVRVATHFGFIDNGRIVRELLAEEVRENSKKCLRLSVLDTKGLSRVMDEMNLEYTILPEDKLDIDEVNISKLIINLSQVNCEVNGMQEHDESLENY